MKRLIRCSRRVAAYYPDRYIFTSGKDKFIVQMRNEDSPEFEAQISSINHSEGLAWAKIDDNKTVKFIQDGSVVEQDKLSLYNKSKYKSLDDYISDVLNDVCEELIEIDKKSKKYGKVSYN